MSLPDTCIVFNLTVYEAERLAAMQQREPDPDLWQLHTNVVRSSSIFRFLEQAGFIYENMYDNDWCWFDISEWYFAGTQEAPQLLIPLE